jgi:hypothetical protein
VFGPRRQAARGGVALQQVDGAAQIQRHLLGRQQAHPAGGQFDGQRHARHGLDDVDHRAQVACQS